MSQCVQCSVSSISSMASLSFLLLSVALIHSAQSLPAARGGGRGLDVSVGGVRRHRRDLHNLLPYEEKMMSYPATQGGGGANHLYYQSDGRRGRGLDQALQRLMERYQREEQEEEQRAVYVTVLLRLLNDAQSSGMVDPGDVEVVEEEEEEEDDQGPPGDFQGLAPPDYDETAGGLKMGRPPPPAAWWGLLEPQMAQALLDRMEPQLAQTLLERTRPQQAGRVPSGPIRGDQDSMRRLVARLLSSIGPNGLRVRRDLSIKVEPVSSAHRRAEPVSSAHRRSRRSLDDVTPPSPSNNPPLLRVKRLEEEEPRPPAAGLQRMKREEELHHGSRRRRRRTANYDSQILIDQILEYMRE